MTSACERVLDTPELLEAILLQLTPLNELLLAQRISCRFHNAISNTPSIQKALFFKPDTTTPAHEWTTNQLLKEHFAPFFIIYTDRIGWLDYSVLQLLDWTDSNRKAFLYEHASWRKMFPVSNPPERLEVRSLSHGMGGDSVVSAVVPFNGNADDELNDGVGYLTMGLLYDLVESYLASLQGSFPRFKVEYFDDENNGARIVLELGMTQQCCQVTPEEIVLLRSKGAQVSALSCLGKWKVDEEFSEHSMDEDDNEGERSALTAEKGGLEAWEWQEWLRERRPLSSLSADVRG